MQEAEATGAPARSSAIVFAYFATLSFLVCLIDPTGQFVDISLTYLLKDTLHVSASEVGMFRLVTAIPCYLAFIFGLARDLWNPFGWRDRGLLLVFAPLAALVLLAPGFVPLSYASILVVSLLLFAVSRFLVAATQGLLALIGQKKMLTGRLSVVWVVASYIPYIAGALGSGYVAAHFTVPQFFRLLAAIAALLAVFALWRPRRVFQHAYDSPLARGSDFIGDVRRLLRHRATYPVIVIMLLFQFGPASGIVFQYHLTDRLHASEAIYGYWYAIFLASFVPMFLGYGYLCQRVRFGRLLRIAALIGVPQACPLLFANSPETALLTAIPMGLMGGLIWAAIYDSPRVPAHRDCTAL